MPLSVDEISGLISLRKVEMERISIVKYRDPTEVQYRGEDNLGRLLSDFRRKELSGFNYPELEQGVRQFKEGMEGREVMCEAVERYAEKYAEGKYNSGKIEGRLEGRVEGKLEGKLEAKLESIRAIMQNLHLSEEEAMDSIGVPKNEWEQYRKML